MKLYEATNGIEGCSYMRVYVWAENGKQAIDMANAEFKKWKIDKVSNIKELFDSDTKPFCSKPSDEGFEL